MCALWDDYRDSYSPKSVKCRMRVFGDNTQLATSKLNPDSLLRISEVEPHPGARIGRGRGLGSGAFEKPDIPGVLNNPSERHIKVGRELVGVIVFAAQPAEVEDEDVVAGEEGGDLDIERAGDLAEGLHGGVFPAGLDMRDGRLAEF